VEKDSGQTYSDEALTRVEPASSRPNVDSQMVCAGGVTRYQRVHTVEGLAVTGPHSQPG